MKFLKELKEFAGVDEIEAKLQYGYEDEELDPVIQVELDDIVDSIYGFLEQYSMHMSEDEFLAYIEDRIKGEEDLGEGQLDEARRAWKRVKVKGRAVLKRWYRCTSGPKKGKMVSNPRVCATRKDPKKVRLGRVIARRRKAIRIRKSQVTARTATHRMMVKMNKRLSAPVVRRTD